MYRPKNSIPTVRITIATTPRVRDLLDELVEGQMYGKTRAEVADELLRQSLRQLMDVQLSSPPPSPPKRRRKNRE